MLTIFDVVSNAHGSVLALKEMAEKVQLACLNHPELIREPYRSRVQRGAHPLTGACYYASEAMYHLMGCPKHLHPKVVTLRPYETHWFLETNSGIIVDVTGAQLEDEQTEYVYTMAKRKGFLTKQPSKRAQVIIDEVRGNI